MCRECEGYPPDEDNEDSPDDLARYEDMRAAYERFGDDAPAWWNSNRCTDCGITMPHPKYAKVLHEGGTRLLVCNGCAIERSKDAFLAKLVPGWAA